MIANYGYRDGSGTFLITIDTEKCDGCGECVSACPCSVLQVISNDFDPIGEGMMAAVAEEHRNKIKYKCAPCKPVSRRKELPCVEVCVPGAITHSW